MELIKPRKLVQGDTIATLSLSWGCAGTSRVRWQYEAGVKQLESIGLHVIAAPNSMRGTAYLSSHPEARAEDLMWAFEQKDISAIIANIGGNDSIRLLPFLDTEVIRSNPKILCGYSDILSIHLYCYQAGLMTYYGDNLLTTVAEVPEWHNYSKYYFERTFFDDTPIGKIEPSKDWSYSADHHTNKQYHKTYIKNPGYEKVQGKGAARGRLFGGHGVLMEYEDGCGINITKKDFVNRLFFFEDIPEVCTPDYIEIFFDWMGENGFLQVLNGIIIGKMRIESSFEPYAVKIRKIISGKYHLPNLPILYGVNFGHTSPICILPYGVMAEVDVEQLSFSILEAAVQ